MSGRILFTVLLILLAGCAQGAGTDSTTSNTPPPGEAPVATAPAVITTPPTPAQDSGVVVGRLVSRAASSPLASQTVYLGERLPLEPGPGYLITLEQEGSPHTTTDANGRFVFASISPGDYPLIIWTPFRSLVVPDAGGQEEFTVTVTAGGTTDLGELQVDWP